jgi:membrane-associated phospholipid phosphatase
MPVVAQYFSRPFSSFVANLGDIALIAPCALAVLVLLLLQRRPIEAFGWGLGLLLCVVVTFTLKMTLGSFRVTLLGHTFGAASFPSGHAALSTTFYGGIALLVWSSTRNWVGIAAAAALGVLVLLIGLSVYDRRWHYQLDIACGFLLGLACIAVMAWFGLTRSRSVAELLGILAAVVVLGTATHGLRVDYLVELPKLGVPARSR